MFSILLFVASAALGNSCGVELTITEKLGLVNMVATQQFQRDADHTTPQAKQYLYCIARSMRMSVDEHLLFVKYTRDRQNPQLFAELGLSPDVGAFVAPIWFKFCIDQQDCDLKGKFFQLTVRARRNALELERIALTTQQPAAEVRIVDTGESIVDTSESIVDRGESIVDTGESILDTGESIVDTSSTFLQVPTSLAYEKSTEGGEKTVEIAPPGDVVDGWITDYFAETAGYDALPPPVTGDLCLFERVRLGAALATDPSISSASLSQKLGRAVNDPQVVRLHETFSLIMCMPRRAYELYKRTGRMSDVQKKFPEMNLFHLNFWFSMPQTELHYDLDHDMYVFPLSLRATGFEAVTGTAQNKFETILIRGLSDAQKLLDLQDRNSDFYRYISAAFTMNAVVHALLQDPFVPFSRVMVACIERTGNPLACTFNGLDIWRRFCIKRNMCVQTTNPEIWTLTSEGIAHYLEYVSQQLRPLNFGLSLEQSIRVCDSLQGKGASWVPVQDHDYAQFLLSVKEIPVTAYELIMAHTTKPNPRLMNLFYEYAPTVPIEWGPHIVDTWKRVTEYMCTRNLSMMRLTPAGFTDSIAWYKQKLQVQLAKSGTAVPPKVVMMISAPSVSSSSIGDSNVAVSLPESALSGVVGFSNISNGSTSLHSGSDGVAPMVSALKVPAVPLSSGEVQPQKIAMMISAPSIDSVFTVAVPNGVAGGSNVAAPSSASFLSSHRLSSVRNTPIVDTSVASSSVLSRSIGGSNIVTPDSASFSSVLGVSTGGGVTNFLAVGDSLSSTHMGISVEDKIRTCDIILAGSAKKVPAELRPYAKFIISAITLSAPAYLYLLAHYGEVVNVAEFHAHVPQLPIDWLSNVIETWNTECFAKHLCERFEGGWRLTPDGIRAYLYRVKIQSTKSLPNKKRAFIEVSDTSFAAKFCQAYEVSVTDLETVLPAMQLSHSPSTDLLVPAYNTVMRPTVATNEFLALLDANFALSDSELATLIVNRPDTDNSYRNLAKTTFCISVWRKYGSVKEAHPSSGNWQLGPGMINAYLTDLRSEAPHTTQRRIIASK